MLPFVGILLAGKHLDLTDDIVVATLSTPLLLAVARLVSRLLSCLSYHQAQRTTQPLASSAPSSSPSNTRSSQNHTKQPSAPVPLSVSLLAPSLFSPSSLVPPYSSFSAGVVLPPHQPTKPAATLTKKSLYMKRTMLTKSRHPSPLQQASSVAAARAISYLNSPHPARRTRIHLRAYFHRPLAFLPTSLEVWSGGSQRRHRPRENWRGIAFCMRTIRLIPALHILFTLAE